MFNKTVLIADHELGLLYRDRRFVRVLEPGKAKVRTFNGKTEVRIVNLRDLPVSDPALRALYATHREVVEAHFAVADLADGEVGFVYADGNLVDVNGPGALAFYGKRLFDVRLETVDAATVIDVPRELVAPLARLGETTLVVPAEVPSDHVGLLYVDGVLDRKLEPGRYAFLKAVRDVHVAILDLRPHHARGDRPGGPDQGPHRRSRQCDRGLPHRRSGEGGLRDGRRARLPLQGAPVRAA